MNNPHALALTPALVLLLAACSVIPAVTPGERGPAVNRNLITTEEMQASGYTDAFLLVQSLRPHWLQTRGPTSFSKQHSVKVYLDGSLLGGPEDLKQITTSSISSMRFMDGNAATQRWGLDHGQGAIVVSTRGDSLTREPQ